MFKQESNNLNMNAFHFKSDSINMLTSQFLFYMISFSIADKNKAIKGVITKTACAYGQVIKTY